MSIEVLQQIGVCIALVLLFTFVNMKTSDGWLKLFTITGINSFLGVASYLALRAVFA